MKTQATYDVGVYCRLSRDDNNGSTESMSISNQRQLLLNYIQERGWNLQDIYTDDGYSGTTFERPDFKRMIGDIEAGKINLVITKDLSRLGRNYVMTGQYTDFVFPQYGVRYIAINDSYDSAKEDNDIAPFKNILNEMYAKDISKKIKSSRTLSAKQGKFMGSQPPFGYIKSPDNKYLLVPDEDVAEIVKRIFKLYAMGDSGRHIASVLNDEGIPSPAVYHYNKSGKIHPNPKVSKTWGSATIMQLLKNQVYLGNMVQGKRKVTSFKTKQRILTNSDDWIVVEGTHEPLVDVQTWNTVHKRILENQKHKRHKVCHTGEVSLFSGIAKCADCGSAMIFNTKRQDGRIYHIYKCSRYANHGKSVCSIHTVPFSLLEETVLHDIQNNAKLAVADRDTLLQRLMNYGNREQERERLRLEKNLCEVKNRTKEIDGLSQRLFEERHAGNVPDSIFKKLMYDYEQEQDLLKEKAIILKESLADSQDLCYNVSQWADTISQYTMIDTLTRNIVVELIDSIQVSERYEANGEKQQDILINYKFVGSLNHSE